ncbi:phosphatidate phosphatase PAH2-like [Zingiber officinale]|uniref:phosphatidate phosphatase PAH2-like n=1 Tax=Zingiber officinale TaxID=94328 RepID=UPI001C4B1E7C|nr:phosphatidate phosphatase PAH2-like [Zingiber officinale]
MYAVEKLGSYISRGVYTVSGPFHPFGGAVDIIVVQQQDGSFKSSPWYVRFGKFQGVLKTKEKLVKISVNGVEAGFNMYLDHKGEAFFLRDAEAGEQEFFMSPPTSGDETEGTMTNYQSEKNLNFDAEGSQKEMVTQVSNGNSKLVTQTSSKRSTILGFVFGRKTFKEIHDGENVKEVNSMERAEITADLLEVKWSTNMKSRDQRVDEVKSPDNGEMSAYVSNDNYGPLTTFPKDCLHPNENLNAYGGGMDNGCGKTISTGDNLEELKHRVGEEPADVYSSEGGKNSTCERKNSEFVSESPGNNPQIANFGFVGISPDSFGSHSDELGESMNNMLSGIISEEMASCGDVQIETMGINDTDVRNKSVPDLVALQSDETGVQNSSSTAYCHDEMQCHTESHMDSTLAVSTLETGNMEVSSFCYWQTIENSTNRSNITDYKITDNLGPISGGFEHCESGILCHANMVLEVSSIAGAGASVINENSEYNHDQSLETARKSESSLSENSQYDSPIEEALIDSDNYDFGSMSYPTSYFKQISSGIRFSLNEQIPGCESEVISVDAVAGESAHVQEMNFQKIDLLGNHSCMEETGIAQVASCPASIPGNPPKYGVFTKSASISELLNSYNSDNAAQEVEGFDQKCNLTGVYSLEHINVARDLSTITKPREVAEYSVSHFESSDDVQFPFSDIDNYGAKEINPELSDNEKVGETKYFQSPNAEIDLETQDLEIKNNKCSLSNSGAFSSQSSPIVISSCKRCSGVNELSSKSLPIVRSHIKDLEVSPVHHSLSSCSLVEKNDIQEAVISSDSEEEEPKSSLTNATVEVSLCNHLLFEGMGIDAASQQFDAEKVNVEKFIALGPSVVKDERLVVRIGDQYFPWSAAAPIVLGMVCFGQKEMLEPQGMIPVERVEKTLGTSKSMPIQPRGNWNIWPFVKKSKTLSNPEALSEVGNDLILDPDFRSNGRIAQESDIIKIKNSKKVQSLTPTSEELASLNLKEGKNVVTFNFSTAMLGVQQVDARIYLWKWNTRIVVSDVDGTITKSDVLGQFMPLVGMDWSQTGVTHLFSGIKDNGYQLLFLSARAISQAYLTRQFLFNLKQDGKALPDGPVVISPDGLFPSLYREVIRRAPHEFKISCLEAIRALFPPDCNPFYAGFGNRDTDEISYLKVGIPIGKIFIINPKGQVAVNRRVDTKSYASLHQLVNGIFPPMSSFEQEDYNSWNFWRLPLPDVDI